MQSNTWKEVLLEDVADEITVGYVGPMASEYVSEGIPFLRSQNVEPLVINQNDIKYITPEFHKKIKKSALRPGDVVIVRTGKPGASAVIPEWLPISNCSDLVIIRSGARLDSRFLAYYINAIAGHHVSAHLVGAVQQHFNVGSARKIKINLPNIEEQRAIAGILGALDDKIELNHRMNRTLESMARAVFRQWFVESEDIEGWEEINLGQFADVIDCMHSKKPDRETEGKPLIQLWNILDNGLLDMTDTYFITEESYKHWVSRIEASPGDCVITNTGRVAAIAQIPEGYKAALGRNMTGIRCKKQFPYPTFLLECLRSDSMRQEIDRKTDVGTILNSLNVRNIPTLQFRLPPREQMENYEKTARPFRAMMEKNLAQSRTLASLRDTLLPKLMRGEVKVRLEER